MSDSDSIHSTDVPPPVPPKDDFRPMIPPKDFPRAFSYMGPSNSSNLNNETTTKRAKRKSLFPSFGSLFTPNTTKATTNDDVPRISSHSGSMFSKISSWWSNLSKLKPRNTANGTPITIPSTSSSATSLITSQITDDANNIQSSPKVKRSKSITTTSSRNQTNKRASFISFIEKLNRKFSFSSKKSNSTKSSNNQKVSSRINQSKTDWSSSASTYHNGDVKRSNAKQKQKMTTNNHDLTASTQTLCPDGSSISTTHSTAAETMESYNNEYENIEDISIDVLEPLRYSIAKSNSSDDTIRGASKTNRHSRLLDIFTPKSTSQRGSTSSRGSIVHTTNGVPNRHIRINSNVIKDPTSLDDMQRENYENRLSSQICTNLDIPYYTIDNEGEDGASSSDLATEGQSKSDMSPLRPNPHQQSSIMEMDRFLSSLCASPDNGTTPSNQPFSRMSWIAKSFDSEDPSAFHIRPDSIIANLKVTVPLRSAKDAFSNPQSIDSKGPAILSNCRIAFIP
ncbi:16755_t:CDS:2, partial [Cetraspora pellucida]